MATWSRSTPTDRILNSAYNMTRQAVQHYTHKFVDIDKSLFSMPAPPGTDQIVGMVDDLLASYPSSLTFPQICDLVLFEVFTKLKEARGWLRRIFPQLDLPARVEAVRKFIGALVAMEACPGYVLDAVVTAGKPITAEPKSQTQEPPRPVPSIEEKTLEPTRAQAGPGAAQDGANGEAENGPKQEDLDLADGAATKTP
jgi:hypothetical protein